jgi:hypothetical protein
MIHFTRLPYRLGWSIWIDGKDWDIQYTPFRLETKEQIRIGDWAILATRLVPFVNIYKIKYCSPLTNE